MDVTKPYKSIGFGAMDVTKPYIFIRFGAMDVTKPYRFIGFGAGADRPIWRVWAAPAGRTNRPNDGALRGQAVGWAFLPAGTAQTHKIDDFRSAPQTP